MEMIHNTFVIERTYPRSAGDVFAAFSVPEKKRRWYAEGGAHDVLSYDLDFRLGGAEVLIGKMKPDTPVAGAVLKWSQTFIDIVEDKRIVFTQTVDFEDRRISCALISVDLKPEAAGCAMMFTHQGVFFEGADGPEMREMGWRGLLDGAADALD